VRFFACGEYGEGRGRPHYHLLLFGFDFPDKVYLKESAGGAKLYRSPMLEHLWPCGFSCTGAVTYESAAYVARYILKKTLGDGGKSYDVADPETGEIVGELGREFVTMSRRPGIGAAWIKRWHGEVYGRSDNYVVVRGQRMRPPSYYDRFLEKADPARFDRMKVQRVDAGLNHADDRTPDRLRVREAVTKARVATFARRSYEQ